MTADVSCRKGMTFKSWNPGPEVPLFILKSHQKIFRKRQHKSQILQNVLIQKWAQNLLVFSACSCLLSSGGACPASASENMWFILPPCKAEHLDSSTLIPMFNSCQLYVLLGIVESTAASALGFPSCTWHCSSCHSSTVIRISVCNSLFVLQSEFLLLGFLLFQNCNPSGHLMKHKSNSSAGELSLDFAVCGGQLHFWSWMKIHVTLAHLNLSLRFIWLEVMCLSEGKKKCHQCLQCGSWECGTSCKVAV